MSETPEQPKVKAPVDLDKPVENRELVAQMVRVNQTRTQEDRHRMLQMLCS